MGGIVMENDLYSMISRKKGEEIKLGYLYMIFLSAIYLFFAAIFVVIITHYDLKFLREIITRTRILDIFLAYFILAPWVVVAQLERYAKKYQGKINYYQLLVLLLDCRIDCQKEKIDFNKYSYRQLYEQYIGNYMPGYYLKRLWRSFTETFFLGCLVVLIVAIITR